MFPKFERVVFCKCNHFSHGEPLWYILRALLSTCFTTCIQNNTIYSTDHTKRMNFNAPNKYLDKQLGRFASEYWNTFSSGYVFYGLLNGEKLDFVLCDACTYDTHKGYKFMEQRVRSVPLSNWSIKKHDVASNVMRSLESNAVGGELIFYCNSIFIQAGGILYFVVFF